MSNNERNGSPDVGKYEYWEECYSDELKHFESSGDRGEIWFGDRVFETLVEWTVQLIANKFDNPLEAHILDIGCGNGHFLIELHHQGFQQLTGTDYSTNSISLCQKIAESENINAIRFLVDDILQSNIPDQFDVVFDKGTFDAITLSQNGHQKKSLYVTSVSNLLRTNGVFVITSCNFIADELIDIFNSHFNPIDHVKSYKKFSFGGSEGSPVSTVAFQLKNDTLSKD